MSTNTFSCRIQYLDDRNPFVTSNFPEPTRPPTYPFLTNVPLSSQLANIHSNLKAPLKVEFKNSSHPYIFLKYFYLRLKTVRFKFTNKMAQKLNMGLI